MSDRASRSAKHVRQIANELRRLANTKAKHVWEIEEPAARLFLELRGRALNSPEYVTLWHAVDAVIAEGRQSGGVPSNRTEVVSCLMAAVGWFVDRGYQGFKKSDKTNSLDNCNYESVAALIERELSQHDDTIQVLRENNRLRREELRHRQFDAVGQRIANSSGASIVVRGSGKVYHPANKVGAGQRSKRKKRRRRRMADSSLTEKQMEAMHLFSEYKGNLSRGARAMGVCYSTFRQHVQSAHRKLGRKMGRNPSTQRLPQDSRGQAMIDSDRRH